MSWSPQKNSIPFLTAKLKGASTGRQHIPAVPQKLMSSLSSPPKLNKKAAVSAGSHRQSNSIAAQMQRAGTQIRVAGIKPAGSPLTPQPRPYANTAQAFASRLERRPAPPVYQPQPAREVLQAKSYSDTSAVRTQSGNSAPAVYQPSPSAEAVQAKSLFPTSKAGFMPHPKMPPQTNGKANPTVVVARRDSGFTANNFSFRMVQQKAVQRRRVIGPHTLGTIDTEDYTEQELVRMIGQHLSAPGTYNMMVAVLDAIDAGEYVERDEDHHSRDYNLASRWYLAQNPFQEIPVDQFILSRDMYECIEAEYQNRVYSVFFEDYLTATNPAKIATIDTTDYPESSLTPLRVRQDGQTDDDEPKPLYRIIDGRHRFIWYVNHNFGLVPALITG